MKKLLLFIALVVSLCAKSQTLQNMPSALLIAQSSYNKDVVLKKTSDLNLRTIQVSTINGETSFEYYDVEYKGGFYKISKAQVVPSDFTKEAEDFFVSLNDARKLQKQLLGEVEVLKKVYTDSIEIAKQHGEAIHQKAIAAARSDHQQKIDAYYYGNDKARSAYNAVEIVRNRLSSPNYAGGCNYYLYIRNKSDKEIKYITWKGAVFNSVNDLVSCEVRSTPYVSGRATGPIAPQMTSEAVYDCIIYNPSARKVVLSGICIEYMDGSVFNMSGLDVTLLENAPKLKIPSKISDKEVERIEKIRSMLDIYRVRVCNKSWIPSFDDLAIVETYKVAEMREKYINLRKKITDYQIKYGYFAGVPF